MLRRAGLAAITVLTALLISSCGSDANEMALPDAPRIDASGPDGSTSVDAALVDGPPGVDASVDASDPTCTDIGSEPNDSEGARTVFSSIDDCDGNGGATTGVVDGSGDIDWFGFAAVDGTTCVADPAATVTTTAEVRLCIFAECTLGATLISCPSGSTAETSPLGRDGCCTTGVVADLAFGIGDLDCDGEDEDAAIYLRIDQPAGNACLNYTLDYHY